MTKPEIEQEKQLASDAVNAAENMVLLKLLEAEEGTLRAHAQQAKDEALKVGDEEDGTAQKLNEQATGMEELAKQMEATRAEIKKNPQKDFSAKVKNLQVKADSSVMHVESDLHEAEVKEEIHHTEEQSVKANAAAATKDGDKDKEKEKEKPKSVEKNTKESAKTKGKTTAKKEKPVAANKTITVVLVTKKAQPHTPKPEKHEHSTMHAVKEYCQEKKKEYLDPILHSAPVATAMHWGSKIGHAAMNPVETADKLMHKAQEFGKEVVDTSVRKVKEMAHAGKALIDSSINKAKEMTKSAAKAVLDKLPSMPTLPSMTVLTGISWLSFGDDEEKKPVQKPAAKTKPVAKPKPATIASAKQIAVVKKVKEVKIPAGISKGSPVAANDDLPSPRHVLDDDDKQLTHHS